MKQSWKKVNFAHSLQKISLWGSVVHDYTLFCNSVMCAADFKLNLMYFSCCRRLRLTWTPLGASKPKRSVAMSTFGAFSSMSSFRCHFGLFSSRGPSLGSDLLCTIARMCQVETVERKWFFQMGAFQSLRSFAGRPFLRLPRDPDHVLQADLEHEHLLHDEEHPRHRATGPLNHIYIIT